MVWMKIYTFKDSESAASFVKSLPLCRRYGWNENKVRVIVEEKSDLKDVDAMAEHAGGRAEAGWEERG